MCASLLNAMAKELGLSKNDFVDLVRCPLSIENYLAIKKERLASELRMLKRG